jgi:hypothetical protein
VNIHFAIGTVLLFSTFGCGRPSDPKVDLRNDLVGDGFTDASCKKGQCKPIEYSLVNGSGESIDSAVAQGVVGKPVEWSIKVQAAVKSQRIKIAIIQAPQWMQKKSAGESGAIVLTGTPTEFTSKSQIIVLARDMARCAALEQTSKDCLSPDKSFNAYDRKVPMIFSIATGGSPSNGGANSNNNGSGQPNNLTTPPPNENCKNNGGILGAIAGKIPFVGGLFNKGSGC